MLDTAPPERLTIITLDHPAAHVLRTVCAQVDTWNPAVMEAVALWAKGMAEAMQANSPRGIGLAANQVGLNWAFFYRAGGPERAQAVCQPPLQGKLIVDGGAPTPEGRR